MFGNKKNIANEVTELVDEFQSRLNEIKNKVKTSKAQDAGVDNGIRIVEPPDFSHAVTLDSQMDLTNEEWDNIFDIAAGVNNILAERKRKMEEFYEQAKL